MTGRFAEALTTADRPVIAEVKRRDAHGRDLFADRSPEEIAAAYEAAGAPCLSVVTGRWFGGTPELLPRVAAATGLPVLQKDFITTRAQLARAVEYGASAVLLTAAVLPGEVLETLVPRCLNLGLTPFVEVTTEEEVRSVPRPDRCVIAVNNKDIRDRERGPGDLGRSRALLSALITAGTSCPVSASAIDTPQAAARLLDAGFAGLLVGTALLSEGSPEGWLADLDRSRNTEQEERIPPW